MDSSKSAIYGMAAINDVGLDLNIRVKFAIRITEMLDALNSACPLVQSPPCLKQGYQSQIRSAIILSSHN